MELLTRTQELVALMNGRSSAAELERAEAEARAALERCDDPGAIDQALALAADDAPIAFKTAAFERRLQVGPREPHVLVAFADHLWLHGPEHDDRVRALRLEAEQMQPSKG